MWGFRYLTRPIDDRDCGAARGPPFSTKFSRGTSLAAPCVSTNRRAELWSAWTFASDARDSAMRSAFRLFVATAVGCGPVMPPVVRAQGPALSTQPDSSRLDLYSLKSCSAGPGMTTSFSSDPGTNPPADYGSPIAPSASLNYTGKYTRFSSGYTGSFVRYMTLSELNSLQQQLRATIEQRANARLTFFGQEFFNAAPTTDVLQLGGDSFFAPDPLNTASGGVRAGSGAMKRNTRQLQDVGGRSGVEKLLTEERESSISPLFDRRAQLLLKVWSFRVM